MAPGPDSITCEHIANMQESAADHLWSMIRRAYVGGASDSSEWDIVEMNDMRIRCGWWRSERKHK